METQRQDWTISMCYPHPFAESAGGLYTFLQEIYGDQPTMTRVEVDVEALSGGPFGTPHLEVTDVRGYAGNEQLLPDFERVPYWKEILAASPRLFDECITLQDRLETVKALLERERLYLEYGLDWPFVNEKGITSLHFIPAKRHLVANKRTVNANRVKDLSTDHSAFSEEKERGSKENTKPDAPPFPYAYTVSLTTHQMLYQEVTVESETPLSEEETIQKALALAGNEWEAGPRDENPDVDYVQMLRGKPEEQEE